MKREYDEIHFEIHFGPENHQTSVRISRILFLMITTPEAREPPSSVDAPQ
jgi:hypothetical protein